MRIGDDCVEQFRTLYLKQKKGKTPRGKPLEAVNRKPNRVGQADEDFILWRDEGQGSEESIAKAMWFLLNGIADGSIGVFPAKILHDVTLPGRDNKANSLCAGDGHAFEQVFAHGARPLLVRVHADANRQQFFRKGQRLYASAQAGSGYDSPSVAHGVDSIRSISSAARFAAVCSASTRC